MWNHRVYGGPFPFETWLSLGTSSHVITRIQNLCIGHAATSPDAPLLPVTSRDLPRPLLIFLRLLAGAWGSRDRATAGWAPGGPAAARRVREGNRAGPARRSVAAAGATVSTT